MRVEPYGVGSVVHITKRGTRGMDIVRDYADHERFVQLLYYMNDSYQDTNWYKAVESLSLFQRPSYWPDREPLVRILAWTLMPNHFHLLAEEIIEGGISKFMQRLCGSMSSHFNAKYHERGSLFQSAFHSRTVIEDSHLRYLTFYIQVKNVLELHPGGLRRIVSKSDFNTAWQWALQYEFSSFGSYVQQKDPSVTESDLLRSLYPNVVEFKKEAQGLLNGHIEHHQQDDTLAPLLLEPW